MRRKPATFERYTLSPAVSDCIEWDGYINTDGYGRFGRRMAHRVVYERVIGPIPDQMLVCHKCDNPPCCNPNHFFLGTVRDNAIDMSEKRRARGSNGGQDKTHCVNGHAYTPENTYWKPAKVACRDCRACIRERVASYRLRRAA